MYTFKKEERLCNKKLIESLFHNGSSFLCYPFKASWLPVDDAMPYPAQVLITVSKKRYKRAVDRNLVKRRIREAYRLNKQLHLYQQMNEAGKRLVFSISYIGKDIVPYELMNKKMLKLLQQLSSEVVK
ncbi:MAG: ribonuclease P protein component [Mucilaginibacter sp.]